MKKLADISAFESIQPNVVPDMAVFNEFEAKVRINNYKELDAILKALGCLGYDRVQKRAGFDEGTFYDYMDSFCNEGHLVDLVDIVDRLYDAGWFDDILDDEDELEEVE